MRFFVYEHITGGGFMGSALPASLAEEGELMVRALIRDLLDIPGAEVLAMRDGRLPSLSRPVRNFIPSQAEPADGLFRHCCVVADAVWPIAPESSGILENISRVALDCSRVLLGSSPDAIRVSGNKLITARLLARAGIAVVPAYAEFAALPAEFSRVVIKPADGAGCVDTYLLERAAARRWWLDHDHGNYLLQAFIDGDALSLSMLCRTGEAKLLCINRQRVIVENGKFRFTGVGVNELADREGIYARLAGEIAAAIPGLWGYVGVDLIQTAQGPLVLEVNPRLTTSYVGLREALRCNPAALVLGLIDAAPGEHQIPFYARSVEIEACHVG